MASERKLAQAVAFNKAHTETITLRYKKYLKLRELYGAAADLEGDSMTSYIIRVVNTHIAEHHPELFTGHMDTLQNDMEMAMVEAQRTGNISAAMLAYKSYTVFFRYVWDQVHKRKQ